MIDEKKIQTLTSSFKRILVLPMSKSTFREMQNAVQGAVNGDASSLNEVIESLLSGNVKPEVSKKYPSSLKQFIEQFTMQTNVAKDVAEKGEVISLITSDILSQANRAIFVTRVRRVDGEEFHFITDADSIVQILHHFVGRLHDLSKGDTTGKIKEALKKELLTLQKRINDIEAS